MNHPVWCSWSGSFYMVTMRARLQREGGPPSSRIFSRPWTMGKGTHFNPKVTCISSAHIPLASTGHVGLLRCKGGWEIEPLAGQPLFSNISTQLEVRNIILWWSAICFCHHYCFLFSLPCPRNIMFSLEMGRGQRLGRIKSLSWEWQGIWWLTQTVHSPVTGTLWWGAERTPRMRPPPIPHWWAQQTLSRKPASDAVFFFSASPAMPPEL